MILENGESAPRPLICVVDDDEGLRVSLTDLLEAEGMEVRAFASAQVMLADGLLDRAACILLDVQLPGSSGMEVQQALVSAGCNTPIVFITGHADVPMSVQAMKRGASDFLTKPFTATQLLSAVSEAMRTGFERRREAEATAEVAAQFATLTPREREVMAAVTKGLMNKQIAYELGIAEITVKIHRGNVMRKMGVTSVAELVKHASLLEAS